MNTTIGLRIAALLATGMKIEAAFDAVMGEGAYRNLAGEVYDALNAK